MSLPARFDRESNALIALVSASPRGMLTFALYDHPSVRDRAAEYVKHRLRIPFDVIVLSAAQKRVADAISQAGNRKKCIFVYHLEDALPDFLAHAERNAERFQQSPHAVIFWVSEATFQKVLRGAPALAALRCRLFDYREREESWNPAPIPANTVVCDNLEEIKERVALYRKRLKDCTDPHRIADLCNRLGFSLAFLREYPEAQRAIRRSLSLARQTGDVALQADNLFLLGQVALYSNSLRRAEILLNASSKLLKGDCDAGLHWALSSLASRKGDLTAATHHGEMSVAKSRSAGDPEGLALALRQLAQCYQAENRLGDAELALREALHLPKDRIGPRDRALAEWSVAEIAARKGDLDGAESQMWRILRQFQDLRDMQSLAMAWYRLAGIAESRRDWLVAEERLQEASWLWREAGRADYAEKIDQQIASMRQFRNWDSNPIVAHP